MFNDPNTRRYNISNCGMRSKQSLDKHKYPCHDCLILASCTDECNAFMKYLSLFNPRIINDGMMICVLKALTKMNTSKIISVDYSLEYAKECYIIFVCGNNTRMVISGSLTSLGMDGNEYLSFYKFIDKLMHIAEPVIEIEYGC